jgi:hypothetical protein
MDARAMTRVIRLWADDAPTNVGSRVPCVVAYCDQLAVFALANDDLTNTLLVCPTHLAEMGPKERDDERTQ